MKTNYKIFRDMDNNYINRLKLSYLLTDIIYNCEYKNNSYIIKGIYKHTKIDECYVFQ